jgi:hypothetical protein
MNIIENPLLIQWLAITFYSFFMGFCFCDGFKLHIVRKLIWWITFLIICIYVLKTEGEFDLALILPIPSLLAILLCIQQKRASDKPQSKGAV